MVGVVKCTFILRVVVAPLEAAQRGRAKQHLAVLHVAVLRVRAGVAVVVGYVAEHDDASENGDVVQHSLEHVAAHAFERQVDAVRVLLLQHGIEVLPPVVTEPINSERFEILDLLVRVAGANHVVAGELGELDGELPRGARGGGHEDRLAGLHFARLLKRKRADTPQVVRGTSAGDSSGELMIFVAGTSKYSEKAPMSGKTKRTREYAGVCKVIRTLLGAYGSRRRCT